MVLWGHPGGNAQRAVGEGPRAWDENLEVVSLEEMSHPVKMGIKEQRSRKRLWGNTVAWREEAMEKPGGGAHGGDSRG